MSALRTFTYKARDNGGATSTGTVSAASADEVAARLRAEGKYVVSVQDSSAGTAAELDEQQVRRSHAAKRVSRDDVIVLCQQLSVMLETGVPLTEALEAMSVQTARPEFRQVLQSLQEDICNGERFSTAMAKWPRIFPNMIISLMKASEASGTMALMLGRISEYLGKERRTARQIKSALSYPIFMMATALLLSIGLMAFVLPRFAKVYEMRAAALPTPTRILLNVSHVVTEYYLYYGPALVVMGIGLFIFVRRPAGKRCCDWLRLHLPVLRLMYQQLYITRSARTMGTLLASGVNLLDIISICRGVTANHYYDKLWTHMEQGVRDGKQVSDSVFQCPYIPRNIASMINSGERSGRLAEVMERIADFSEEELDNAVKKVTSYIEPTMILFMGVVVGGVAMALLLPIFNMGNMMSR